MTFTGRITTITQNIILAKNYDNFFGDTSFIPYRFMGNGLEWSGGAALEIPITIGKNTYGTSYSGMAKFTTGTLETRVKMSYDPRAYVIPVQIPGLEKAVNKGEAATLKLVTQEIKTTFESLLDDVSDMGYADGTGNSNKNFLGLDALADDGTSAPTIATLSRTTYPTLAGVRTASGGTVTLDKLATFYMNLTSGSGQKNCPTVFVTDKTTWNYLEKLIVTGTVQANYTANGYPVVNRRSKAPVGGLAGEAGFKSILYKGTPIIFDGNATAQTLWGLNENYLQWYGLRSDDLKAITMDFLDGSANADAPSADTGLQWSGFKDSFNQFGEVAYIHKLGNWITPKPGTQGRLTGITGA